MLLTCKVSTKLAMTLCSVQVPGTHLQCLLVQLVTGALLGQVSQELALNADVLHLLATILTVPMQTPSEESPAASSQMLCRAEGPRLLRRHTGAHGSCKELCQELA